MRVIPSAVMALTTILVLCAFAIKANADPVQQRQWLDALLGLSR